MSSHFSLETWVSAHSSRDAAIETVCQGGEFLRRQRQSQEIIKLALKTNLIKN
jgi:hypothetical protein